MTSEIPRPVGRSSYAVAFDTPRDRVLLFGGLGIDHQRLADLWEWRSRDARWSRITSDGPSPPPSEGGALIEDLAHRRMLLLTGWQGPGLPVELWQLSLVGPPTWSRIPLTGPGPDFAESAVLDAVRGRIVVEGATFDSDLGFHRGIWRLGLEDAWHWTTMPVVGATGWSGGMTLDRARDRVLLFGGFIGDNGTSLEGFPLASDSVQLQRLSGPNHGLDDRPDLISNIGGIVVDPVRDRLVAFGGEGETLAYDRIGSDLATEIPLTGAPLWTELDPVEGGPPPTRYAPIVYDPVRDAIVVFGAGESGDLGTFELEREHEGWPVAEPRVIAGTQFGVRIEWSAPQPYARALDRVPVLRTSGDEPWSPAGEATRTTEGRLMFLDRGPQAGVRLRYRLAWPLAGGSIPVGETEVTVGLPTHAAMAFNGNPARSSIRFDLDLPRAGFVRLQLLDPAGRLVCERSLSTPAGRQPLEIVPPAAVKPGLYFVRASGPWGAATGRVTLLR
jgi:hypothetical protein